MTLHSFLYKSVSKPYLIKLYTIIFLEIIFFLFHARPFVIDIIYTICTNFMLAKSASISYTKIADNLDIRALANTPFSAINHARQEFCNFTFVPKMERSYYDLRNKYINAIIDGAYIYGLLSPMTFRILWWMKKLFYVQWHQKSYFSLITTNAPPSHTDDGAKCLNW